jgi:hypothetical protein
METLNRLQFRIAEQVQVPVIEGYGLVFNPETGEYMENPMYTADITGFYGPGDEGAESPAETSTDGVSEYDECSWDSTDASEQWSPSDEN